MTLLEYLRQGKYRDVFGADDYNEIIGSIYNRFKRALADGAEEMTLNSAHFIWSKDGQTLGQRFIGDLQPDRSFRESLELILKRDEFLRSHLRLFYNSPEEVTYIIKPELDA